MDYGRETGNVVQIITGGGSRNGADYWGDQPVWATEDEYGVWDREASVDTTSNSNYDGRQSQTRSGSEPPNKKTRNGQGGDVQASSRSKAIGKMFFKTKLCCKFRAGTCPYITNCNFAHSIEELRRPPPNWQEIVAAHEEERAVSSEPREEFQIPSLGSSSFTVDSQRSYKGRHCKKFYTEEGCPYGDNCTFLHDEQSKARESVVISLGPGSGGGYGGVGASGGGGGGAGGGGGGGGGGVGGSGGGVAEAAGSNSILKPSNWKTRICNKWEQTGYCPFGKLHRYGGGLVDIDAKDSPTAMDSNKQGVMSSKIPIETVVAAGPSAAHSDGYHVGAPSQRLPGVIPRTGQRPFQKWKGPDKISRIYGDWIDEIE
ncbi:Zinc finger, CCCH-type [Cynara cardunculus var. scolymus]|uniref:Zinc finger, CCCH-type n=1 Tax=Cynara cardunculus var. scolymus TaxID=59895 RepID=A0A103XGE9_CYNCS|nr:Zinc finger, CCCH-type [Cynara cardunculus var. scolymus]